MNTSKYHRIDNLLATLVVEAGLLDAASVAACQQQCQSSSTENNSLDRLLVTRHHVSLPSLGTLLAKHYGALYRPLAAELLPADSEEPLQNGSSSFLSNLPDSFVFQKQALPLRCENGRLLVATPDPTVPGLADEITLLTGLRPEWLITTPMELADAWSAHCQHRQQKTQSMATAQATHNELSIVTITEELLQKALTQDASDIHLEPRLHDVMVRFRLQGVLEPIQTLSLSLGAGLITRIKVLAKLDVAEHRRPQDGQFKIPFQGQDAFCRVSIIPVADQNEKASLRLLKPLELSVTSSLLPVSQHKAALHTDLSQLGLSEWDQERLNLLLAVPNGMILTCGPTGTGKSTTLYALLQQLNTPQRNICTVEDPIERRIEGVNQSPLNPKANLTYATSIRALLRQDPDVMMVGEIRDAETLGVTVQAALTGHLILSSFHSNSATTAITRMMELDVSPKLLSSALSGIIAQRLVRTLCHHCKAPVVPSTADREFLFPYDEIARQKEWTIYEAVGCPLCQNRGYTGRTGVFEILLLDRELRYLVAQNIPELQLEDAAIAAGMRTLSLNGRMKVLQGITSLEEIRRVLGHEL
ncbi:MAG: GspE/PulE family protein [Vampirovibrionales bacterium]|nr:GspE/PulE family protein [Vampirovibrionales bacterium]